MFEIVFTDAYDRAIERMSMYRPKPETRTALVLEAIERLDTNPLIYGFQVIDDTKP